MKTLPLQLSGIHKHAQRNIFPVFHSASSLKKIPYLLRRFTLLSFAKDGVWVICWGYRSLVPCLCVLFPFELLCLAVVNFDGQVGCWTSRREARLLKSRRFTNTKRWTMVNFYRWINLDATATNVDAWFLDVLSLFLWARLTLKADRREIELFLALETLSGSKASPKQITSTQRPPYANKSPVSMEENVHRRKLKAIVRYR